MVVDDLRRRLTTPSVQLVVVWPTVRIEGDWEISFNPQGFWTQADGEVLYWQASRPSQRWRHHTLEGLLEAIKREE